MIDLKDMAAAYRRMLCEDVLAWWLRHAIDARYGGVLSCIRDDGKIVSHDKYVWSQVRALWTFSAAYNRIERDPLYLKTAQQLFDFCIAHGRTPEGDWAFLLSREGKLLDGPSSIQTDAYAICALVEYARATGDSAAVDAAYATYRRNLDRLARPGSYQTKPYPIPPGTKAQRVSMQFSLAYGELARLTNDPDARADMLRLVDDVLDNFRRPELKATVEYLSLDNSTLPPPIGTYASPGHGIETAWFQIENLRETGDRARLNKAIDILRWSLERGWNEQYGGLVLGLDLAGGEPYLPHSDTKIWWPHCEAICGTLMAYEIDPQDWCLQWHQRVIDWSLAHFPDREHGEWTQRLDRKGQKINTVVALPVKDPFHLPRALIYAIEALQRMETSC